MERSPPFPLKPAFSLHAGAALGLADDSFVQLGHDRQRFPCLPPAVTMYPLDPPAVKRFDSDTSLLSVACQADT